MKKGLLLLGVVVALGLCVTAAQSVEEAVPKAKTGAVTKVDLEGKQLVVDRTTFTVTDDTKIVKGEEEKTLGDVKVGDKVTVEYKADGKKLIAIKITITAEEEAE